MALIHYAAKTDKFSYINLYSLLKRSDIDINLKTNNDIFFYL